jgi:hypothetical protein
MICKVKQDVWLRYQWPAIRSWEEARGDELRGLRLSATIEFDSFRDHPRWLKAENRTGLSIKKTNCESWTPVRTKKSTRKWVETAEAMLAKDDLVGSAEKT